MKKILITGANGQLGSELSVLSKRYPQYDWIFADRTQITLDNLELLKNQLAEIHPDIILNCGAYTAVDKAETEKELAFAVNELAIKQIAKFASDNKAKLIHISTDYVFDGSSSTALNEEAATNPLNIYGESKLAGELACIKENPESIIIRTSWVYSRFGNNFVKTMQRLMQERDSINVVCDQIGSPTYAADLAQVMIDIIASPKWQSGIYNFSNEGEISWFEFAQAIKEIGSFDCNLTGVSSSEYPTVAKRPQYSLLDKSKIKEVYGAQVPNYKESLKKMMAIVA